MKLRKLLKEARHQYAFRSIHVDEYVRMDGLQWVLEEIMMVGPELPPIKSEYRFRSEEDAEEFRKAKYWERVAWNIEDLRKKYKRPSKRELKMAVMPNNVQPIKSKTMRKKVFALVSGIVGALQTAGVAIVTYTSPENATVINSAIVAAGAAIIEVCNLFIKTE